MTVITEWRQLAGSRVKVTFNGKDEVVGILRGVPAERTVIVQDPATWDETKFDDVSAVVPELFTCTDCRGQVNKLQEGDVCAYCYRTEAEKRRHAEPFPPTPCDDCGTKPAFRNPKGTDNTKLRCAVCHAKNGDLPRDYGIITRSFPAAVCVGQDIDSPKHKWVRMKSSRWRCEGFGCNTDRYTPPLGT